MQKQSSVQPESTGRVEGKGAPGGSEGSLVVSELYRSIQGESSFAGFPCGFVRLTGCPLRCVWCDSEFAFSGGRAMTIGEILDEVRALGVNLIEVTGGEPLAQPRCLDLLSRLCDAGYEVLLETSGSIDVAPVDPRVIKIVDIKCPGSGEEHSNRLENIDRLGPRDEIKFVLADRADYEWARDFIRARNLDKRTGEGSGLLLSPVHGQLNSPDLAQWIQEDGLRARLQIQLHKHLWPGRDRGV